MNDCEKIAEMIMEAEGELEGESARLVESHFAACEKCRADLDELRSRAAGAATTAPDVAEERWARLWCRIEERTEEKRLPRRVRRSLFQGFALTAAAAAVLVAAYLFTPRRFADEVADMGRFELVSFEVSSPEYDVAILASSEGEIPVIWLERL